MFEKIYHILLRQNSLSMLLAVFLSLVLLTGCATSGGSYARLDRDRDLDNRFRNYEVMQDYNYYTSGGYDKPNAILLIHKDYVLDNPGNLWVEVPYVDYNQMRKWIYVISSEQDAKRSGDYFATYMLDEKGNRVGIWYSVEMFATAKFLGENRILVYTPELRQESLLSNIIWEEFEF